MSLPSDDGDVSCYLMTHGMMEIAHGVHVPTCTRGSMTKPLAPNPFPRHSIQAQICTENYMSNYVSLSYLLVYYIVRSTVS